MARVIPIILRPTFWEKTPMSKLQALPKDAKPVTSWKNRDEAWLDIVNSIRKVYDELKELRDKTSSPPADSPKKIIKTDDEINIMEKAIFPFSILIKFKKLKISSDLHRYSLIVNLNLNRPPSKIGFFFRLLWPNFVQISHMAGLTSSKSVMNNNIEYSDLIYECDDKIYPGQTIQIIGPEGKAELEYEFNDKIYSIVDDNDIWLQWKIFFNDSMPMDGKINFNHLNIY